MLHWLLERSGISAKPSLTAYKPLANVANSHFPGSKSPHLHYRVAFPGLGQLLASLNIHSQAAVANKLASFKMCEGKLLWLTIYFSSSSSTFYFLFTIYVLYVHGLSETFQNCSKLASTLEMNSKPFWTGVMFTISNKPDFRVVKDRIQVTFTSGIND